MDEKTTAVLDTYHDMIDNERNGRPQTVPGWPEGARDSSLLAVGPQTGQLLNIIAGSFEAPTILEIGTSFGYSGIWLGEAARATGGRLITMEAAEHKSTFAHEMAVRAGLADHMDFMVGDAVEMIASLSQRIDFVLLDLWKDLYVPCLEAFYPKLNPGAVIVADNIIWPGGENTARYSRSVRAKPGMTSVLLPVGSGLEVSRYEPD